MSTIISVQLDELAALADELAGLARELDADAQACRSAVPVLRESLGGGSEGWHAAVAARAWSSLVGLVSDRARETADALRSAVAGYRATDAAIGDRMCPADPAYAPRP